MLEIEKSTPRSTKKTNKISVEEISNTASPKKSKSNKPKPNIKKSSSKGDLGSILMTYIIKANRVGWANLIIQ